MSIHLRDSATNRSIVYEIYTDPWFHTVYPPVIVFEENNLIRKRKLFTGARDLSRVSYLFIFSCTSLYFEDIFGHISVFFTLFQETNLPGFIARHYMILFCCLVMLRIWGNSVGRVSFNTWNNRQLERQKQSHIHRFRIRVCHNRSDDHSISMTYHISNHFNSIIHCLY